MKVLKHDVLVVGGGIVGAGIFRDLTLNHLDVCLIEKKTFGSQTSSRSSKMLHGGIRYLENYDFKLVFEALHEKNLWIKLAPSMAYSESFYLPVYKNSLRPLWMIRIGLFLYDFLSGFQNTPHQVKTPSQTKENIEDIKLDGLIGAGVYHDAVVDDEKLCREVILDGVKRGNHAIEFTSLLSISILEDQTYECLVLNEKNNEKFIIRCKKLVMATGPFTDRLMHSLKIFNWSDKLLPSKGAHIWLKPSAIKLKKAMLLQLNDGRVLFVIPQNGKILIGTTETKLQEEMFDITASQADIDYILQSIKEFFPTANLGPDQILSSFAGVRPLVKESDSLELGKTAREHKVFRPHRNCFVILGGKYTTFRVMGQEISRNIVHSLGGQYNSNISKTKLF